MKRTLCLIFACLFFVVPVATVLARDGHHGDRGHGGHHGGHHGSRGHHWNGGGHHWGGHHGGHHGGHGWSHRGHHGGHHGRNHYNDHYRHYYPWGYAPYYDEWYGPRYRPYNYGYYVPPLVEFNFDLFGDPKPPALPPVQRQQYEQLPEEVPQRFVEERRVSQERLEVLRTQAARDYREKKPMPYDTFDSMSEEERRAYGEEWDRLMLVSGGKGPFFKKKWR